MIVKQCTDAYRQGELLTDYVYNCEKDDTANAAAWRALGAAVKPMATVLVKGEQLTGQQCLLKALSLDPDDALAWNGLGLSMGGSERYRRWPDLHAAAVLCQSP